MHNVCTYSPGMERAYSAAHDNHMHIRRVVAKALVDAGLAIYLRKGKLPSVLLANDGLIALDEKELLMCCKAINEERLKRWCASFLEPWSCPYCEEWSDTRDVDHIIPKTFGGPDVDWNIIECCTNCNRKKGQRFLLPKRRPPKFDKNAVDWARNRAPYCTFAGALLQVISI